MIADRGRLADHPLPTLLNHLFDTSATGVLRLSARTGRHEVFVRAGYPVSVSLPGSAELIGKVLLEMGMLDEATYRQTLVEPPPPGQRYGEMLLQKQLVSADQIRLALKAQVRRKLHRLFFLNDGDYAFEAGEHQQGLQAQESLRVHPFRAIYHGVRSAWHAERLSGALCLLEGRAIQCKLSLDEVARYGTGTDDGRVAELLRRGYWTLPDLVEAANLPVQPVHSLVYAFYITGALDLRNPDEVPRLRRKDGGGTTPVPIAPAAAARPTPSAAAAPAPSAAPAPASIAVAPPTAAPAPSLPVSAPTRSWPPQPRRMSGTFASPGMNGSAIRGATAEEAATAASELAVVRRQVESKARVVDTENLFEVLGLPITAGRDEIKSAYFEAAKRFHPDRLSSLAMDSLRPDMEKIFRRVTEAYGTLFDDKRREEYCAELARPHGEGADSDAHQRAVKLLEAEMAFRRGEIQLRKNDYAGALREFEAAVAGNPQEGEHLAYLTWARVCAGQVTHHDAQAKLVEATRLSPKCARAFYFLGVCLKEGNDIDRAAAMFRKAAELDARMLDAERELRLINMRKEKGGDKKGLFDRWRKPTK